MALTEELVSLFAKTVNGVGNTDTKKTASTAYGKIIEYNGKKYAQLDGSDQLTPVETTVSVNNGDRVTVKMENHTATVTGNLSDPAASGNTVTEMGSHISEFEIIISHKVTTEELDATNAYIENLKAISAKFDELSAVTAEITELQAKMATIEHLKASDIEALIATFENLRARFGEFDVISTEDLTAVNAEIDNLKAYVGNFTYVSTDVLNAIQAAVKQLDTDKLNAKDAEIKYANIDFANITELAVKKIFADYGVIEEIVIGEGTVVKELIGVRIKGDLIEANSLKVDRLIVKGTDGNYYALSTDFSGIPNVEPVEEDAIHGSIIIAKSVTAEKISVDDLFAFDATIGGFEITKEAIHSHAKTSVENTVRGIYMDNLGQIAFGEGDHYIRFAYDEETDTYRLVIAADSIIFGGDKSVESELSHMAETLENTTSSATESSTKIAQLRTLLSQIVTDENGNSMMIETPDTYVRTTEAMSAVEGVLVDGVSTTDGDPVYVFEGEYYTMVDSVYYRVDYTPGTCTFNISDLEAAINAANGELSSLSGKMDSIDSIVVGIQKSVEELGLVGGYIYIDPEFNTGNGDTVPAIVLGESSSDFKVVITNEQIAFMEGSAVPAYISGQTLIAQNIEVKQQLTQGGFSWTTQGGNIGLIWTGRTTVSVTFNNYTDLNPVVNVPQTATVGRSSGSNFNFTNIAVAKKATLVCYMGGVIYRSTDIKEKQAGQTVAYVSGVSRVTDDLVYELRYV